MLKILTVAFWLLFSVISVAHARDVSIQQAGYNNALQKAEKAEKEYKADAQAVAETEKIIEKKNKQLAEEQRKAELSKSKYLEAKQNLDQAQQVLDKAWQD